MLFGRVKGTAVCTLKYPGTEGLKLLIVQPLNKKLEPVGLLQVAADVVEAGPGDLCVMVRSREAALALPEIKFVPVDLALVGVVDDLDVHPDGEFDYTLKPGKESDLHNMGTHENHAWRPYTHPGHFPPCPPRLSGIPSRDNLLRDPSGKGKNSKFVFWSAPRSQYISSLP